MLIFIDYKIIYWNGYHCCFDCRLSVLFATLSSLYFPLNLHIWVVLIPSCNLCILNGWSLVRLPLFQVARVCINCGVNMGEYFCEICKFYDDDVIWSSIQRFWLKTFDSRSNLMLNRHSCLVQIDKGQFHCDDCGICRFVEEHDYSNLLHKIMFFSSDVWLFSRVFRIGGRENFFHCKKCGMSVVTTWLKRVKNGVFQLYAILISNLCSW